VPQLVALPQRDPIQTRSDNIGDYKALLVPAFPDLADTAVYIPRYGLSIKPWSNWSGESQPDCWRAHNNVKHYRDSHFQEATLKNALDALGALLLLCLHYYSRKLATQQRSGLSRQETAQRLMPQSQFMRLDESWYYSVVVAG